MRITRILVPLDGSKNSLKGLDMAIYLSRQCDAKITGLFVFPFYLPLSGPRVWGPYRAEILRQMHKFMYESKVRCARKGIVFYEKIIKGDVISADITNFANRKKFDLMVVSSRGFGPIKDLFLGSVSNALVHKSKIPILVVK